MIVRIPDPSSLGSAPIGYERSHGEAEPCKIGTGISADRRAASCKQIELAAGAARSICRKNRRGR